MASGFLIYTNGQQNYSTSIRYLFNCKIRRANTSNELDVYSDEIFHNFDADYLDDSLYIASELLIQYIKRFPGSSCSSILSIMVSL